MLLDLIPGVGSAKMMTEAATGHDLVTGSNLSGLERGLNAAFAVLPYAGDIFRAGKGFLSAGEEAKGAASVAGAATAATEDVNTVNGAVSSDLNAELSASNEQEAEQALTCGVGPNSFRADTPVEIDAKGDTVAISALKVGDHVLAYNPSDGSTGIFTVTAVLVHTDPTLIDLTISGETIETTPQHPFYVEGKGWVNAGELHQGDHIRRADGTFGTVEAVKVVEHSQTMYNLTVATAHTFFVGEEHWLVHNQSPTPIPPGGGWGGYKGNGPCNGWLYPNIPDWSPLDPKEVITELPKDGEPALNGYYTYILTWDGKVRLYLNNPVRFAHHSDLVFANEFESAEQVVVGYAGSVRFEDRSSYLY